ncbi:MAG: methyltransferase [Selenomonadaceae bacterium]|nr:methyltransferase [Selenomonadaceae bacterium]MBQ9498375.1 methyltransferase [Selenomonadaceae bacterium]
MRSGRVIIQDENEFCFSMDAVLIAHFPRFKKNARVIDLGTGTGVIPLLIADDVKEICAVELNSRMADLARRNVELNGLSEKIFVVEGDYRKHREIFKAESFDAAIANPPYTPLTNGEPNKISGIARARHEFTATLEDVVTAARFVLKFHGAFFMIHLASRLCEIVDALHRHQMEMKRLRMIHPKAGRDANLIMLEAVVGANVGNLKILPPLIVHNDDGSYTEEIYKIYSL